MLLYIIFFSFIQVSTPLDYQACPEPRSTTIKHGIGKGLMAKNGTPVKRHGIGKGLMTKKSAPMKKHGIGKGLMTVWRVTNPDGGDFPTGIGSSTFSNFSLLAKKKSLQRRQSLMVSHLIHILQVYKFFKQILFLKVFQSTLVRETFALWFFSKYIDVYRTMEWHFNQVPLRNLLMTNFEISV